MSKMVKSAGAKKRKIPAAESDKEIRWRLRELDTVDAELGSEYYEKSLEKIMARVEEKTETKKSTSSSRSKQAHHHISLISSP